MADRNLSSRTLCHRDNLGFLRGMNSETVDLIAFLIPKWRGFV